MKRRYMKVPQEIKDLRLKSGVFIITHKLTGKSYVGTTQNLYTIYHTFRNKETTELNYRYPTAIHIAIKEHGWDAFKFDYELCPLESLTLIAAIWMDKLNSVEGGYNTRMDPRRAEKYYPSNDENVMCQNCGVNKVFAGYIKGVYAVRKKCRECLLAYNRKYYHKHSGPTNEIPQFTDTEAEVWCGDEYVIDMIYKNGDWQMRGEAV